MLSITKHLYSLWLSTAACVCRWCSVSHSYLHKSILLEASQSAMVYNCRDTRAGSSSHCCQFFSILFCPLKLLYWNVCFTSVLVFPKDLILSFRFALQVCVFMVRSISHIIPNFLCMTNFSVLKRIIANLSLEFLVASFDLIFVFFFSIVFLLCWFFLLYRCTGKLSKRFKKLEKMILL